jgi:hypothetical protein
MFKIQREILEAYEQSSRAWVARIKSEVDLWSELAAKLTAARSVPEALRAYQEVVAQRVEMAAEDGRRLFEDCQETMQKITRLAPNGWRTGTK